MSAWVESLLLFVLDMLLTYVILRWLFGVSAHVALPVAWVAASIRMPLYRIERRLE